MNLLITQFSLASCYFSLRYEYEGYSESNHQWAVNKTSNQKNKFIIYKKMYTLKLLLNVVTAGIEAFVSGNKVLYASVKEVCCL
jgi:hypothetical protein